MPFLGDELARVKALGRHRVLRRFDGPQEPATRMDGRDVLLFCSNNYLGLSTHPDVVAAAQEAVRTWGTGAGGSRLISGSTTLHRDLETDLARLKGTEDALVFGTGYQANLGAVCALVGPEDRIASDRLNHASLIDACRSSRAQVEVYTHGDAADARRALTDATVRRPLPDATVRRAPIPGATVRQADTADATRGALAGPPGRRRLLLTDGVFSMDGDEAPLAALADVARERDAMFMVDDAHGTGVLGGGAGTAAEHGVAGHVDIHMGTLSKALASQGGFIAGSAELIDYLRNVSRPFIFSTAPAPASIAAARAALDVVRREPARIQRLLRNADHLRKGLSKLGLQVLPGRTPIIPVLVGHEAEAMDLMRRLEAEGVYVAAVRPPTVAPGSCRLRVTVMATHTAEQIQACIDAFDAAAGNLVAGRAAGKVPAGTMEVDTSLASS